MEVHFKADLQTKVNRLAAENQSDAAEYVQQIVGHYGDHDGWFRQKVRAGLAQLDRGEYQQQRVAVPARRHRRIGVSRSHEIKDLLSGLALSGVRRGLPGFPQGQPLGEGGADHGHAFRTEEDAERRLFRVDYLQDGRQGCLRITELDLCAVGEQLRQPLSMFFFVMDTSA
jgi:predicted transcriptional regulator